MVWFSKGTSFQLTPSLSSHKVLSDLQILFQTRAYPLTHKPIVAFKVSCKYGIALIILTLFGLFLTNFSIYISSHSLLLLFFKLIAMTIKFMQKQDTLGRISLFLPCIKHLLCVAAGFVLLFIFTWQFWRENIPLLLQAKLCLESSNRLHIFNFMENKL